MKECIERDAALSELDEWYEMYPESDVAREALSLAKKAISKLPAADVVPVVRCSECIHAPLPGEAWYGNEIEWPKTENGVTDYTCPYCVGDRWYSQRPAPDFFCARGEKG